MLGRVDDGWPDPGLLLDNLRAAAPADAVDRAGELLVAVDRAIGEQLAAVFAAADFARLESAWRAVLGMLPADDSGVVVQLADVPAADVSGDWLDRAVYAGPVDTRGGQPIGLLALGEPPADPAAVETVAERAVCPVVGPTDPRGGLLFQTDRPIELRPPLAANPAWAGWFDWPTAAGADRPLRGGAAQAVAAAVIRSVIAFAWPIDASDAAPDALPRQLMAARFAHLAATRCRGSTGRPAALAEAVADGLRGRYVGPRLPLRWVEVAVEPASPGRLACTLRTAPRLGGDDPDEVVVTVRIVVGGG